MVYEMQFFDQSDKSLMQEGWDFFTQSRNLIKNV